MHDILSKLPAVLLGWYAENRRILPWRADKDPYHVWLSEIMLQQTRVEAVKGYYCRFLEELPTIEALAECDDDRLHKLWEGLGYYSRVRNLKKAARILVLEHGGKMPEDYDQILALPGVGEYTAGAVCSICFDMPKAAVDGNVLRVISRVLNDSAPIDDPVQKKKIRMALEAVYPGTAGDFTQALMELGATICGPNRAPDCKKCPCSGFCLGHQLGTACDLPVKSPKKKRRIEEKTVFILRCGDSYAVTKRTDRGLLAGLWQLPDTSGCLETGSALAYLRSLGIPIKGIFRQVDKQHIFTHVQWNMRGIYLEASDQAGPWEWYSEQHVETELALPTAFRQFWEERAV